MWKQYLFCIIYRKVCNMMCTAFHHCCKLYLQLICIHSCKHCTIHQVTFTPVQHCYQFEDNYFVFISSTQWQSDYFYWYCLSLPKNCGSMAFCHERNASPDIMFHHWKISKSEWANYSWGTKHQISVCKEPIPWQ